MATFNDAVRTLSDISYRYEKTIQLAQVEMEKTVNAAKAEMELCLAGGDPSAADICLLCGQPKPQSEDITESDTNTVNSGIDIPSRLPGGTT